MRLSTTTQLATLADELRAIAATALFYSQDPHDRDRFARVRSLAAELLATVDQREPAELERLFAQDSTPRSPLIGVDAAVIRADGCLLLVRARGGYDWRLPGGLVDIGESPADAAVRHAWAEARTQVVVTGIAAVYDARRDPGGPGFQTLRHVHRCEVAAECPQTGIGTTRGWFNAAHITSLDINPGQREVVNHILRSASGRPSSFRLKTPTFHGIRCS